MPIDTSLYGRFPPPPRESPYTALSQFVNAQTAIGQLRAQQQAQADQAAIRQVLTETGGNIKEALPRLRTIAPAAALDFESKLAEQQTHAWEALVKQTDLENKRVDLGLRGLTGVHDDRTYQIWRRRMQGIDPDLAAIAGDRFDPARRDELLQLGTTAKEALDLRRESLKAFNTGEAGKGLATFLSTAQSQQDWDNGLAAARAAGVPETVIAQFPAQWSLENAQRAATMGISPEKRAELAGQAETRTQTAAHQAEQEAIARGQLAVSQGQLGVARAREAREAAAAPGGGTAEDAKAATQGAMDLVTRLKTHPGMARATGAYELRGFTQEAVDFNSIRDQLVAALALPNLGQLKGPLSDKDLLFIKNVSTRLGNRRLSEAETRRALNEAADFLEKKGAIPRALENGTTTTQSTTAPDRVRVVGPNGQTGTVPKGTTLPPGWRVQ